jgi:quercetin dioxygenase-like cupin family protein
MTRDTNDHDRDVRGAPGSVRGPRALSGTVLDFDLAMEANRLREESPWTLHGRNALTLVKYSDLRIVLIAMKAGVRQKEHHAGATVAVLALSGRVRLHLAGTPVDLPAMHLLSLERDVPHDLEAIEDSEVLLTIAWHGEQSASATVDVGSEQGAVDAEASCSTRGTRGGGGPQGAEVESTRKGDLSTDKRRSQVASALDPPALGALDSERASSMADEGGASAAGIEGREGRDPAP